jgi:hypothetical protein
MPRRPWVSLNVFSASPIRVPLDQSGAAAAARWIARSGLRPSERAGQSREARGEHERLGVRAAAGGAGQELQVGARVGLHRAGDVAQHHQPARRDDAPAPAREADRVAAGAQARAQRLGACRRARRGGPALRAAGAPQRVASSSRDISFKSWASSWARARRSSCPRALLVAASPAAISSSASRLLLVVVARSRGGEDGCARRGSCSAIRPTSSCARTSGARPAASARSGASSGSKSSSPELLPKTEKKTASKALTWAWSDTNTARASSTGAAGDRLDERQRLREVAERSGVTGTPAARRRSAERADERRQVELDRLDPNTGVVGAAPQPPLPTSCSRPAARITS